MTTLAQRSFSGGELAPALYARVDTSKYGSGARTIRNFLVMRHGGASNRPGSQFVGEVKDSSKTVRLIPFVFNASQTYVLEFGHLYMRVIASGVHLSDTTKTITGITQANPAVVTSAAHGLVAGDEVLIGSVNGMTAINSRSLVVGTTTANTFQLLNKDGTNFNSTALSAYTSGGFAYRIYTIATPYIESHLPELQYVQSADTVTIAHPSYAPRVLKRTGHTAWTLTAISFTPVLSPPPQPTLATGGVNTSPTNHTYAITSISATTGEESLMSTSNTVNFSTSLSSTVYVDLSWATTGLGTTIREWNVYKSKNGVFGFLGVSQNGTFRDQGVSADVKDTAPTERNPFTSTGLGASADGTGYNPSTVAYIQQRLMFANTDANPEHVYGSRTANFYNFTVSSPTQADDAITFRTVGRQVNKIRHLLDLGKLLVFTSGGEWSIEGGTNGILKPAEINPRQHSYYGSGTLPPLVLGNSALFVQARGSVVRDLGYSTEADSYRGNDLTVFSAHLFDGYTLLDWTFQQIPHSIVWCVRSDGKLLGLTYVREHEVLAWHRHDFDGTVENLTSVPEGNEDSLYLVIKRTINGQTKRYVERFATRRVGSITDSVFMDASVTYDGRNLDTAHTMMMTGGVTWLSDDSITLLSFNSFFKTTDVGNAIHLTGSDGSIIRLTITSYVSAFEVVGTPHRTVPVAMRDVTITSWARAVDQVTGLWHLEGKDVAILGDGSVVASPNNDAYTTVTVTNGEILLDKPYGVLHIGLPIVADIETLDIDRADGETLADKQKMVSAVTLFVESSRGIWVGPRPPEDDTLDPLQDLYEVKTRSDEPYDTSVALQTGTEDIKLLPEWNSHGRVFIRQVDQLPLSILAIAPAGLFPLRGQE